MFKPTREDLTERDLKPKTVQKFMDYKLTTNRDAMSQIVDEIQQPGDGDDDDRWRRWAVSTDLDDGER